MSIDGSNEIDGKQCGCLDALLVLTVHNTPYTQYMCNIQINSYKSHCVKNVYNNKWQSQLSLSFCMECNMAIGADFS